MPGSQRPGLNFRNNLINEIIQGLGTKIISVPMAHADTLGVFLACSKDTHIGDAIHPRKANFSANFVTGPIHGDPHPL